MASLRSSSACLVGGALNTSWNRRNNLACHVHEERTMAQTKTTINNPDGGGDCQCVFVLRVSDDTLVKCLTSTLSHCLLSGIVMGIEWASKKRLMIY